MLNLAQMQHGASLKNVKSDAGGDDTLLANQTQESVVVCSSLVSSRQSVFDDEDGRAILMVINRHPMVINTLRNPCRRQFVNWSVLSCPQMFN